MRHALVLVALGCAWRPIKPVQPSPPAACAPRPALPELGEELRPSVTGQLELVSARGDDRLSVGGSGLDASISNGFSAWTPDGAYVAILDREQPTKTRSFRVFRAGDGTFVEARTCPYPKNPRRAAGARWIAPIGAPPADAQLPAPCVDEPTPPDPAGLGDALKAVGLGDEAPASLSTDGARLVIAQCSDPVEVAVWDVPSRTLLWTRQVSSTCETWRFVLGDRAIVDPAAGQLLSATTGELLVPHPALSISPDGTRAIVLGDDGPELWSVDPVGPRPLVEPARSLRPVLGRSDDGSVVAEIVSPGHVALEANGRCVDTGLADGSSVAFSPDARTAVIASGNGVYAIDVATGAVARSIGEARAVAVQAVGARRAAFVRPGGVRIVDLASGRSLVDIDTPVFMFEPTAVTHHATRVVITDGDHPGALELRDGDGVVRTLGELRQGDRPNLLEISPDDRYVASVARALGLWRLDGEPVPANVFRPSGRVTPPAFSRDARWLATALDGGVAVVETATGRIVGQVQLVADDATSLWFDSQARLVIETERGFELVVAISLS